jgi:hypothetical protein
MTKRGSFSASPPIATCYGAKKLNYFFSGSAFEGSDGLEEPAGDQGHENRCSAKYHGHYRKHCDEFQHLIYLLKIQSAGSFRACILSFMAKNRIFEFHKAPCEQSHYDRGRDEDQSDNRHRQQELHHFVHLLNFVNQCITI